MTTDPYRRAIGAYRTAGLQVSGPRQILLRLHEAILADLYQARAAYEARALDRMCDHTEACVRLLTALTCKLDFKLAGPAGGALLAYYRGLLRRLGLILQQPNVSEALLDMINSMREMCRSFRTDTENSMVN